MVTLLRKRPAKAEGATVAADDGVPEAAKLHGEDGGAQEVATPRSDSAAKSRWWTPLRTGAFAAAAMILALAGLIGYLQYRAQEQRAVDVERNLFVEVGKQAAINLTTINYAEADKDVQRILDGSTGAFHDDFQKRSGPFVEVVKQAQSNSVGTITESGLETQDGNRARVLVAVAVKTATPADPNPQPRNWRMRLTVEKLGSEAKVSNVEFVP